MGSTHSAVFTALPAMADAGLRSILDRSLSMHREIRLLAAAECLPAIAEQLAHTPADILLVDLRLLGPGGIRELDRIILEHESLVMAFVEPEMLAEVTDSEITAFLPLPLDPARLQRALARLERMAAERMRTGGRDPGAGTWPERLSVRVGDSYEILHADDIRWIESDDYCSNVHLGERCVSMRTSLKELERCLDPARFLRIHRSAIVNLDHVRALRYRGGGDYRVRMRCGQELRMSRTRRAEFESAVRFLE